VYAIICKFDKLNDDSKVYARNINISILELLPHCLKMHKKTISIHMHNNLLHT